MAFHAQLAAQPGAAPMRYGVHATDQQRLKENWAISDGRDGIPGAGTRKWAW